MDVETVPESNLVVARRLFEWFKRGDLAAFTAALHPDVEAHPSIPGAPVLYGRDAVRAWNASAGALELRPLDYHLRGKHVIVRGYIRYHEGRMLTDRLAFWLFEIEDGMVRRMESYPTREAALAQT